MRAVCLRCACSRFTDNFRHARWNRSCDRLARNRSRLSQIVQTDCSHHGPQSVSGRHESGARPLSGELCGPRPEADRRATHCRYPTIICDPQQPKPGCSTATCQPSALLELTLDRFLANSHVNPTNHFPSTSFRYPINTTLFCHTCDGTFRQPVPAIMMPNPASPASTSTLRC